MRKQYQRRWKCPYCKTDGWSADGAIPKQHARFADNRDCLAYGRARLDAPAFDQEDASPERIMSLPWPWR